MNPLGSGTEPFRPENEPSVPPTFRFFDHSYPDLASNLALDEALLLDAEDDPASRPILRIWDPMRLGVVLGASGRLRDDVEVDICRADGVEIGRRSSGGGTVLIGPGTPNLTVILRTDATPAYKHVDMSQIAVLETVAQSLRQLNPEVRVEGSGDLTIGGRKFSGSAQRRLRRWFMIHATILNTAPIEPIARYTKNPARQPAYREGRPHGSFLTRLELPTESLVTAIRHAWGVTAASESPEDRLHAVVRDMVETRFGRVEWIERL